MMKAAYGTLLRLPLFLFTIGVAWSTYFVPNGSAAEAPACNDQNVLYQVRRAYEFALSTEGSSRTFQGEAVRELGYGGPNAWVNKHAPAKDYYHKSRYCEATMRLDNGQTEQAYFRIDALKVGEADNYNFDPCFIKHQDASRDECLYQRPPKK